MNFTDRKKCCKCKQEKNLDNFHYRSKDKKYKSSTCKSCMKKYRSEYYQNNKEKWKYDPERYQRVDKKSKMIREYGMTLETFDQMIIDQNNLCLICLTEMNRPNIDHCHVTGLVRGILCNNCNRGIGMLKDSPEILRKAADYVEGVL